MNILSLIYCVYKGIVHSLPFCVSLTLPRDGNKWKLPLTWDYTPEFRPYLREPLVSCQPSFVHGQNPLDSAPSVPYTRPMTQVTDEDKAWDRIWPGQEMHEVTWDEVKEWQSTYVERTGWNPADRMPVDLRMSGELSAQVGRRRMWQMRARRMEGMVLLRAMGLDLTPLTERHIGSSGKVDRG